MKPLSRVMLVLTSVPLSACIWLAVLVAKGHGAEAFFYGYFGVGIATSLSVVLVTKLVGSSNFLLMVREVDNAAKSRWGRALSIFDTSMQAVSACLNWPGSVLTIYLYGRRIETGKGFFASLRQQLSSLTHMLEDTVIWMPVVQIAFCFVLFLATRRPRYDSPYVIAVYLTFLGGVMVRHVGTLRQSGRLLPMLRRLPGNPVLRFLAVFICDFTTVVFCTTAIQGWTNLCPFGIQSMAANSRLLINPMALGRLLVPEVHPALLKHVWAASFTDKVTVAAGLLLYVVIVKTLLGGLSEFKRTEDDKVSVALLLCYRGDFERANAVLAEVSTMSLSREGTRVAVNLGLGHPGKAASAARHLIEEAIEEEQDVVRDDDVYAFLVLQSVLLGIKENAALSLWRWGIARPVSSALLLYHSSMLLERVQKPEDLSPFFPPGTEQSVPLATAFFFLMTGRSSDALQIVSAYEARSSEEHLAIFTFWFCGSLKMLEVNERERFAMDFPEAWKLTLFKINQELAEAADWKCMLAIFLNKCLYSVTMKLGNIDAEWLNAESRTLMARFAGRKFGASGIGIAGDLAALIDRQEKRRKSRSET